MIIYLIIHLICFLLSVYLLIKMDNEITLGGTLFSILTGPIGLLMFTVTLIYTNSDPVIWRKKDE